MKNVLRIISVVVLAVMISATLCSCIQLDDLKNERAVWTDDSKKIVEFRGNRYQKINLYGDAVIKNPTYNSALTEADVPILLAYSEGKTFYYDTDVEIPIILVAEKAYGVEYYCLESEYDRISSIDESLTYDSMYIEYQTEYIDYDMVGYNHDYKSIYEIISEEYQDAINRTLESAEESVMIDDNEGSNLSVTRCDSEMLLTNHDMIEVRCVDNEYYVHENINYQFKKVNEDDKEIFKKMFDEYKEAVWGFYYPPAEYEGY